MTASFVRDAGRCGREQPIASAPNKETARTATHAPRGSVSLSGGLVTDGTEAAREHAKATLKAPLASRAERGPRPDIA